MDTTIRGVVQQDSYVTAPDNSLMAPRMTRRGELVLNDFVLQALFDGRVYCSSDADENDTITGQTSFAATTPTLLLRVPSGTTAIPLWLHLDQAGTVAGGIISVLMSYDRIDRFSSGGTSETITPMHTSRPNTAASTLYSGATATAATEARLLYAATLDQDVTDPNLTESIHLHALKDFYPPLLVGPAALLVFTFATVGVGPTWNWSIGWIEMSSGSAD